MIETMLIERYTRGIPLSNSNFNAGKKLHYSPNKPMKVVQISSQSLDKQTSGGSCPTQYPWQKLDDHSERRHLYNSQQIDHCKDDNTVTPSQGTKVQKVQNPHWETQLVYRDPSHGGCPSGPGHVTHLSVSQDFPCGPVVKAPCFQCSACWLDPWWETKLPTRHEVWQKIKNKEKT